MSQDPNTPGTEKADIPFGHPPLDPSKGDPAHQDVSRCPFMRAFNGALDAFRALGPAPATKTDSTAPATKPDATADATSDHAPGPDSDRGDGGRPGDTRAADDRSPPSG